MTWRSSKIHRNCVWPATPLLSADGSTLLSEKTAIFERLAEHFNIMLNRPSSVNEDAINILSQIESNVLLDEFPTVVETKKAKTLSLSSGKAPGADANICRYLKKQNVCKDQELEQSEPKSSPLTQNGK